MINYVLIVQIFSGNGKVVEILKKGKPLVSSETKLNVKCKDELYNLPWDRVVGVSYDK
jgi:hypothetical protein